MQPPDRIPSREITPPEVYVNRRKFLRAAVAAGSVVATGTLYRGLNRPGEAKIETPKLANLVTPVETAEAQPDTRLGKSLDIPRVPEEEWTPYQNVINYNNFYEFTTSKELVGAMSKRFVARPWTVTVDGLVRKPRTFDLDDVLAISPPEERVYRMRCVEAWSMVIPWAGFSLSKLLEAVEPLSSARYVAFETLLDPKRFPGQRTPVLEWPYVEGLRLDEAMHPLTLLVSGVYGRELPAPTGAPLRLVIPWKYGFKGIKSIVRISLTDTQPKTTWSDVMPESYGFLANVNPTVAHPRWSQADEQRIGEFDRRPTLMFNGYTEQVAHLYAGIDLRKNY